MSMVLVTMEFRAGLERSRQADERALMDDLAGVSFNFIQSIAKSSYLLQC